MKRVQFEFGGFYESIHDDNIERMLSLYFNDDNYFENNENIDYKKIQVEYTKQYCELLELHILEVYGIKIEFNDIKLISPKYYNYTTDRIDCAISDIEEIDLISKFRNLTPFNEYLKDRTTSRSGFVSFYSLEEALGNKNNILVDYIMSFICNEFETLDYFFNLWDEQCGYELLNYIDFLIKD